MRNNTLAAAVGMAAISVSIQAVAASAGDAPEKSDGRSALEEVIVTAQKREERAQDVPVAITVFDAAALAKKGVTSFGDLTQKVPALSITPYSYSSATLAVFMRGVGQVDVINVARDPGVGIYVDDVYLARSTGLTSDLGEIERVEVLRGPQGTLYGRNTIGGAVKFITAKPTGTFGLKETIDVGNLGRLRSLTSINLPEWEGISSKLSYMRSSFDGWVDNPGTGGDFGVKDQESWRVALRWQASDQVTVDYSYDRATQDGTPNYFQFAQGPGYQGVVTGIAQPNFVTRSARPVDFPLRDDFTESGHALTVNWNISDLLSLKSVSSYRRIESLLQLDTVEAFNQPVGEYYRSDQDAFQQEFLLNGSTPTANLKYNLGAFYFTESADQVFAYNVDGFTATHYPTLAHVLANSLPGEAKNSAAGLYSNLTWTPPVLDGRLDLTAGVRYSWDKREAKGGLLAVGSGEVDYTSVDPSVTADYRWTEDVHTYVKYARAYRAGGFNLFNSRLRSFDPERLASWEVGLKSMWWQDRLRFNINVFSQDYTDIQVGFIDVAPGTSTLVTFTENLGEARFRGVEGEIELMPLDGLKLTADYSYLDARIVEVGSAGVFTTPPVLSNAPKWKYNLGAEYTFAPFGFGTLSALAGYSYQDEQYSGGADLTPGYGLYNARLTLADLALGRGKVAISLWGNNLSDEHYTYFKNVSAVIYGEPRSYGVNATFSY